MARKTEYYKDIDIELETKNDGDIKRDINEDAVENSLMNILNTFKGSRRMLPTFANNLYYYLFEPIDEVTAYSIGEDMLEAINTWDDRISVSNIRVVPNYDNNRYDISVSYFIIGTKEERKIDYILEKI